MHLTKLKLYLNIFLFYRRYRWHRWQTFSCDYIREFSQKIRNNPNGILGGQGETDLWKKPEVENLVSDSLRIFNYNEKIENTELEVDAEKYCIICRR